MVWSLSFRSVSYTHLDVYKRQILSYIMCKAMNRSFISVIAGGFGTDGSSTGDDQEVGEHREITAEETAELLKMCIRDSQYVGQWRSRFFRHPRAGVMQNSTQTMGAF